MILTEREKIMSGCKVLGAVVLSVLLSASASAACGGGGYNPQKAKSGAPTTATSATETHAVSSSTANFDASYFHSISGQLHMSGEQASNVIKALIDIRNKLGETPPPAKDFDPKKEFEKRLATILNPQQFKTFQDATKAS